MSPWCMLQVETYFREEEEEKQGESRERKVQGTCTTFLGYFKFPKPFLFHHKHHKHHKHSKFLYTPESSPGTFSAGIEFGVFVGI